jgi:hypothetical protein
MQNKEGLWLCDAVQSGSRTSLCVSEGVCDFVLQFRMDRGFCEAVQRGLRTL